MTWRRFVALVRGLSPMSAFLDYISRDDSPRQDGSQTGPKSAKIIEDTQEGERAVLRLLGG